MFSVLPNGLEHSRKKRSSNDLIFDSFRVGENDSEISGIFTVEELEILVVRALTNDV